jgi:predicted glycogen debranching enzyme
MPPDLHREWLEADGLGGFASGLASGIAARRYHALLLVARQPPTDRVVLVNGVEAAVVTPTGRYPLSAHHYLQDVVYPDGHHRIVDFTSDPWPTWTFRVDEETEVTQELFAVHGSPRVVLRWKLVGPGPAGLEVRPLLSGRDYHALHHENPVHSFEARVSGEHVRLQPYQGLPPITLTTNGAFQPAPEWYRSFSYELEAERGLDHVEDLASPGVLSFELSDIPAVLVLAAGEPAAEPPALELATQLADREAARRGMFSDSIHRAADAYVVRRGAATTVVAGYPWFTDWGRDTFIALRGLCCATGRLDEAAQILAEWSGAVSEGMLPNRFPDSGGAPEYNSVDASLWFVVAVHDLLAAFEREGRVFPAAGREQLVRAVNAILEGHAAGTRHGIRLQPDGLLAAGEPGVQLTWMDAKIGDWVVTPRIGKPVEIQALWLNALLIGADLNKAQAQRWRAFAAAGRAAFEARFWNPARGFLFDVVDVDHEPGKTDASLRPNQLLAIGGLPHPILEGSRARAVVDVVEATLVTTAGLRSLGPGEPGYVQRYMGGPRERDASYHQGTVWPWLIGPFVEAWVRVRSNSVPVKTEARARFLDPLLGTARNHGGHLFEIADAEPPHTPRGCPFQAWSVGELLRLEQVLSSRQAP